MMMLDASTMVVVLALGNLALCALLTFFDHGPARPPALVLWGLSKQVQGLAWLVMALGDAGVVPPAIAVPAGFALLLAGVAIEGGAAWEAARAPRWRTPTLALGSLAVLVFLLCYLIDADGLRIVAGSLLLGGLYLSGAVALAWRWRDCGHLQRVVAAATALLALAVAARGLAVLGLPGGWSWLSNVLLSQVASGALYLLMLVNGYGVMLMARERLQAMLARLETTDTQTHVPNRRGFYQSLAPWMALARRPGQPTALVVLDLDSFKRVNDSYGHPAGDVVLRQIVDLCRRQLRDSDLMGRLVGVQFALLLPRTSLEEATLVAERVRSAIESTPVKSERAMIKLTASFGVTTLRPEDSTTTLFQRADEALMRAKQSGRNRVERAAESAVEV